ncbi:MAG: 6-phosphogluconolactonase [Luteimonas sp.]
MTASDSPLAVNGWTEHRYDDAAKLQEQVAEQVTLACMHALASRGKALLALAGGRSPLPIYRRVAQADLPWTRVVLVPTDERCVPSGHPASNRVAIADAFGAARGVQVLSLVPVDDASRCTAEHAQRVLEPHRGDFDAVILGMGTDGHIASLFPGAPGLLAALAPDASVDAVRVDPDPLPPEAPFARISLTLARLLRTRACHLVISGEAKLQALRDAAASPDIERLPVAAVLYGTGTDLHVHWSP